MRLDMLTAGSEGIVLCEGYVIWSSLKDAYHYTFQTTVNA